MIGPLTLSLNTANDGVAAAGFFLETKLSQLRVANHDIADNKCLFNYAQSFLILLLTSVLIRAAFVFVPALLAVLFTPGYSLLKLFLIKDIVYYAALDLNLV